MIKNQYYILFLALISKIFFVSFVLAQFEQKTFSKTKSCRQELSAVEATFDWLLESVELHNKYRAIHKATNLTLNLKLSQISQSWANKRASRFKGHNPNRCYLGENIYSRGLTGTEIQNVSMDPVEAVKAWYDEVNYYDFDTGVQIKGKESEKIGHFTQLVWNGSKEIGLGVAKYSEFRNGVEWNWIVVVANYYPPGNSKDFKNNVFSSAISLHLYLNYAFVMLLQSILIRIAISQ